MKLQLFLGISLLSLMCLMWLQGSQAQTASWDYVGQMIDNYAAVTDCIFLAGNTNAGPNYTHTKGTQLTSTSSRMSVASASKMAASAIIYRVIEEGYLSLDDKPSKYLSYWTTSNGDPRSAITLKTLLAFTSGFGADDACCGDNSFTMQSCAQQIYKNATGSNYYSPAGSSFYYTCNHLQVAGAMAEQATGLSWATLFTRFWKNPLAVSSKFTTWTPTNNPNVAGGLYCSTDEYMRFVMSLFDLSFFKSTSTYDLFYTDNTPSDSVTIVYTPLSVALPPQVWHYCQGNWLECEQKPFDSSCTARQVHSSPGKFGFYPRIDRVNNYWSIVARQDLTGLFVYAQSVELFQVIEGNVTALLTNSRATSTATSGTSTTTRSGSSTAATTTNPGTTQTGTGSTTNTVSSTVTTTRTTTRSTSDASSVVHSSLVFLALLSVLQMVFV